MIKEFSGEVKCGFDSIIFSNGFVIKESKDGISQISYSYIKQGELNLLSKKTIECDGVYAVTKYFYNDVGVLLQTVKELFDGSDNPSETKVTSYSDFGNGFYGCDITINGKRLETTVVQKLIDPVKRYCITDLIEPMKNDKEEQ